MIHIWEIRGDIESPGTFPPDIRGATVWVREYSKVRPGKVIRTSIGAEKYVGYRAKFEGIGTNKLILYLGNKKYLIDVEVAIRTPSAEFKPADPP